MSIANSPATIIHDWAIYPPKHPLFKHGQHFFSSSGESPRFSSLADDWSYQILYTATRRIKEEYKRWGLDVNMKNRKYGTKMATTEPHTGRHRLSTIKQPKEYKYLGATKDGTLIRRSN